MTKPCAHPDCHRNIALTADDYCVLHRPGVRFYTLPQSWKGIVWDPDEVRTHSLFPPIRVDQSMPPDAITFEGDVKTAIVNLGLPAEPDLGCIV